MRLEKYITEKRNIGKIYFAHPRATYSKSGEREALRMLKSSYPNYIIVNPNSEKIQGRYDYKGMGFEIFYKVIDTAEMIAVLPLKNGKITFGSWRECEYAHRKGKKIISVDPSRNKIEEVDFFSLRKLTAEETYDLIDPTVRSNFKMYEEYDET